jgi:hypothetical protein
MDVRKKPEHGWIEVITGSMFSGKSEELIRRIRRAQIARQRVQVFKPLVDNRYGDDHIVSHSDMRIPSTNVSSSDEIVAQVAEDTEVVGIDEGQFFDLNLPAACNTLADRGEAGHRRRAGSRLSRAAIRADASAPCHRRVHHQDPGDLHGLRRSGKPHPAARRKRRARCWLARAASTRRAAGIASIPRWRTSKSHRDVL